MNQFLAESTIARRLYLVWTPSYYRILTPFGCRTIVASAKEGEPRDLDLVLGAESASSTWPGIVVEHGLAATENRLAELPCSVRVEDASR